MLEWSRPHLLGIEGLSASEVNHLLDRAESFYGPMPKTDVLRGQVIVNLFFESSTRTRTSFEIAGKKLGADVINVSPSTSSVSKGETLLDTIRNVEAMHADILVLRHASSGAPQFLAKHARASIVNAGDGTHEHPTQALLDVLTMRRCFGSLDGRIVAICGDILHSRVARSNAILLGLLGATVRFTGPRTMIPLEATRLGSTVMVAPTLADAIDGADVVMMLRIQNERLSGAALPTTREYAKTFGLNANMLERAKPNALVMHPGPINRGVEITSAIADGDQSVILDQVTAGVAVRMAVLEAVGLARGAA